MLTVPLGAALTADSVFSDDAIEKNDEVDAEGDNNVGEKYAVSDKIPVPTSPSKVPMSPEKSEKISITSPVVSPPTSPEKKLLPPSYKSLDASELDLQSGVMDNQNTITENGINPPPAERGLTIDTTVEEPQKLPRWVYLGIMFGMVIISLVVISANADRTYVILVAQVFNGCLLPFFSTCLLLCLNDNQFMKSSPQPLWANAFLIISVIITMFLANNAILTKIFGGLLEDVDNAVTIRLGVAVGAAIVEIFLVIVGTSLGKDLWRSFKQSKLSLLCFQEDMMNNTAEERRDSDIKLSKV